MRPFRKSVKGRRVLDKRIARLHGPIRIIPRYERDTLPETSWRLRRRITGTPIYLPVSAPLQPECLHAGVLVPELFGCRE